MKQSALNNRLFVAIAIAMGVLLFSVFAMHSKHKQSINEKSLQPVASEILVRAHSPVKGASMSRVTVVEFLDPECEACRATHPVLMRLIAEYGDRVRFVIRYMPFHGNSLYAASALEEAREFGKFDEALDLLFERQQEWGSHHDPKPEMIAELMKSIGITTPLDPETLIAKHRAKIEHDSSDGKQLGVRVTPTFFINGVKQEGIGYDPLKLALEAALAQ